jgi:hypothetical protein
MPGQENEERRKRVEEMRSKQHAADRRRRLFLLSGGGAVVAAILAVVLVIALSSRGGNNSARAEEIPPGVSGATTVEPAATVTTNNSGISGVVAYVTTGWPITSNNGPADKALRHNHVNGPVRYSVSPPVGGDHNPVWMNCGVYSEPVPSERAVHNLEHGAVWITYQPGLAASEVAVLRNFVTRQTVIAFPGVTGSRYMDLSPYPGLASPIVISSWGFQLRVSSPWDPRLQQFVNRFRVSQTYSPEYGSPCTDGVGTPLQK